MSGSPRLALLREGDDLLRVAAVLCPAAPPRSSGLPEQVDALLLVSSRALRPRHRSSRLRGARTDACGSAPRALPRTSALDRPPDERAETSGEESPAYSKAFAERLFSSERKSSHGSVRRLTHRGSSRVSRPHEHVGLPPRPDVGIWRCLCGSFPLSRAVLRKRGGRS
jgi:hypothetical protein